MSTPQRSTRKRSSAAVAKSAQIAEILNVEGDEKEKEIEAKKEKKAQKTDAEYVPQRKESKNAVSAERETNVQEERLQKRRNSADSVEFNAHGHAAAGSDAKTDAEKAESTQREVGPLSDRSRFLPAGTHAQIAAHAKALFQMAADEDDSGERDFPLQIDVDADTDDEKGTLSSRSSSSSSSAFSRSSISSVDSSPSSARSAGARSSSGANAESSPGHEHPPAVSSNGVAGPAGSERSAGDRVRARSPSDKDEKAAVDEGLPAALDESQSVQSELASPGPQPEDDERPWSPVLVDLSRPRIRGLSQTRMPDQPQLPEPFPAPAPMAVGSDRVRDENMDGKHGESRDSAPVSGQAAPPAAASEPRASDPPAAESDVVLDPAPQRGKRRPKSILNKDRERVGLAVHVLLAGTSTTPKPPITHTQAYDLINALLRKTSMNAHPATFGRLINQAITQQCDFANCSISHSRELLGAQGKTLSRLRWSVASDFQPKKATRRRAVSEPACATAYHQLAPQAPRLCPDVLDPSHDREACRLIHLHNAASEVPFVFPPSVSAQKQAVEMLLSRYVEPVRKANGALDAKAMATSEELINVLDDALSIDTLAPIIRSKTRAGGLFNRHALGRAITNAAFWGNSQRDPKARAFRGFRVKYPKPPLVDVQRELLAEWGPEQQQQQQQQQPVALPPPPADGAAEMSISATQYAFLLANARAYLQQQAQADEQKVNSIDAQIAQLQAQREAAAAAAQTSAAALNAIR